MILYRSTPPHKNKTVNKKVAMFVVWGDERTPRLPTRHELRGRGRALGTNVFLVKRHPPAGVSRLVVGVDVVLISTRMIKSVSHRTGPSYSGAGEYPRGKTQGQNQTWYTRSSS